MNLRILLVFLPLLLGFGFSFICPTKPNEGKQLAYRPPAAAFPVVWSALYLLLGTSMYLGLKFKQPGQGRKLIAPATLFVGLLVALNLWQYFFACQRSKRAGLYCILASAAICSMLMQVQVGKNRRYSSMCLAPLLVWLLFASKMNADIITLDRRPQIKA